MRLIRSILLWCARNAWLRRTVPRLAGMRRAVRRFMPGETMAEALAAAAVLADRGVPVVYTRLGENITDIGQVDRVVADYHELIDALAAEGRGGEISPKLTQLGLDLDLDATTRHTLDLAQHAHRSGSRLWIDMEDRTYVDRTLEVYEQVLRQQEVVGICLQAYLRRTPADVDRLRLHRPAIRLVKGAYDEPADAAYRARREVDDAFRRLAVAMLPWVAAGELTLALATHDTRLIEEIAAVGEQRGIGRDAFEVQMLYGVRTDEQRRLHDEGYRVRVLVAYGDYWYPWYVRRLAERPANLWFAARQMLPW